jgi:hypothetical protein
MKTLSSPRRMKSIPPGRPVLSKVRREGRQPEALLHFGHCTRRGNGLSRSRHPAKSTHCDPAEEQRTGSREPWRPSGGAP